MIRCEISELEKSWFDDYSLVEHRVQISGWLCLLNFLLQVAKVDQTLHAVAQPLTCGFRFFVSLLISSDLRALVLDDLLDVFDAGQGDVLELGRQKPIRQLRLERVDVNVFQILG